MKEILVARGLGFALIFALFLCPYAFAEEASAPEATPTLETASEAEPLSVEEKLIRLEEELFGSVVRTSAGCTATADCEDGSTISCSTSDSSVTCRAQDQDCSAGQGGFVDCGTDAELCSACEPECSSPPLSKCISGNSCEPGCGHCGPGSCFNGSCNCLI